MQRKLISALLLAAALSGGFAHAAGKQKQQQQQSLQGLFGNTPNNTPIMMLAEVDSLDKRVEVAYVCDSQKGKTNLNAMYGIKNDALAAVQLKYGEELTPNLYRVMNDTNGKHQDSYYNSGLTWITAKAATPDKITSVEGKVLMQASSLDGGLPSGDQTLLFKDCKVDKAATKKLNAKK
ncbi:MAG: hypothetical protein Q3966_05995 [Neisseria sp.]|nr:hypothetical protein [Neisseria sp.]